MVVLVSDPPKALVDVLRAAFLSCLAMGCPKATPPDLYPVAAPALGTPPALDYPRAADTCPGVEPFLTGEPPPFVEAGLAACGGLVVPDDEYAALVFAADVAEPWYRVFATECEAGRARDREWARVSYQLEAQRRAEAEREAGLQRAVGPVLFVLGVALGAGVVVGATSIQIDLAQ